MTALDGDEIHPISNWVEEIFETLVEALNNVEDESSRCICISTLTTLLIIPELQILYESTDKVRFFFY